jgi:serine protease Do
MAPTPAPTPDATAFRVQEEVVRHVASTAGAAVVRIGRHGGRGCGVVVAEGQVLTNAHNLRDRTTEVTFADGRRAQGEVVAVDPDGDLVLLAADTAGAAPIEWSPTPAELGTTVLAVARTADAGLRVTTGAVSGAGRAFRGPRGRRVTGSIEHTAPLARGSSGSVVVDVTGRLLGLNTARLGEGFYLALPADAALRARVDGLARGESVGRLVLGVGLAPADVAAKLRRSVGLPERTGLLVRAVEEASPADTAGVLVGDLLVAAGGVARATVDDLHGALDAARATRTLEVQLVRGADELTVQVSFPEPPGE